jgi:hypothetical protein
MFSLSLDAWPAARIPLLLGYVGLFRHSIGRLQSSNGGAVTRF